MAERRNLFEGVSDFFTELGRIREVGTHGYDTTEDRERTHATAGCRRPTSSPAGGTW